MEQRQWQKLFNWLEGRSYYNFPQNPGQLKKHRKESVLQSVEMKLFGLGQTIKVSEFQSLNFPKDLYSLLEFNPTGVKSLYSVSSNLDGTFLAHSHWPPPKDSKEYIHLGPESFFLVREINKISYPLNNTLDLGSGVGVLTEALAKKSQKAFGLDLSVKAVALAQSLSIHKNVEYLNLAIGSKEAKTWVDKQKSFDLIVSNPPLAVPGESEMIHRDGGGYGIEIPKLFCSFAYDNLSAQGELWILIGNPLVHGKWLFYEYLKKETPWQIKEQKIVEEYFNQGQREKHGYDKMAIEKIDLTIFKLKKSI